MDTQQRVAFVIAQAACATAEIEAMKAENAMDIAAGNSPRWAGDAFRDVPNTHQLGWNDVLVYLQG